MERDDEGLFQGVTSGQNGVWDGVGVTHPSRTRWKFQADLRTVLLKILLFLQVIVEAQHKPVVGGMIHGFQAEHFFYAANERMAAPTAFGGEFRETSIGGIIFREGGKSVSGVPDAGFGGIDVGEATQDAAAMHRTRRK